MGTDVHTVFQKKITGDTRLAEMGAAQPGNVSPWTNVTSEYDECRHYRLFSWLAGVRNGYGVAGTITGDKITPIAGPRGLPDDFVHADVVYVGDHTHSWLLGSEIIAALDQLPDIKVCGVLSIEQYHNWDKLTCPSSYLSGIDGRNIITLEQSEVEQALRKNDTASDSNSVCPRISDYEAKIYVRVHWDMSAADLREDFAYFTNEIKRLMEEHGEIRMVFGFDS